MNSLTKENTHLGFIGIGNMGSRMARRLLEHGYQLKAYNRSREAAEALVKYGATVADGIAEIASEADKCLYRCRRCLCSCASRLGNNRDEHRVARDFAPAVRPESQDRSEISGLTGIGQHPGC